MHHKSKKVTAEKKHEHMQEKKKTAHEMKKHTMKKHHSRGK